MTNQALALAHTLMRSQPFVDLLTEIADEERAQLLTRLRAAAKAGEALTARAIEAEMATWDRLEDAFRERASLYRVAAE